MHTWTDDDNLIAYCLYRLGNNEHTLGTPPAELGKMMGMGSNSLSLKVANFKSIDGEGGMTGYSKQAERIENSYRAMSDNELRVAGLEALQRALEKYMNRLSSQRK